MKATYAKRGARVPSQKEIVELLNALSDPSVEKQRVFSVDNIYP